MGKKFEFSKLLLGTVMGTYFIGLFVGVYAVLRILMLHPDDAVMALSSVLGYIGAPVAVAIAFYSWKAKHENVAKINGKGVTVDGLETKVD